MKIEDISRGDKLRYRHEEPVVGYASPSPSEDIQHRSWDETVIVDRVDPHAPCVTVWIELHGRKGTKVVNPEHLYEL